MRFVRVLAGMLLLTIGLPALLVGGSLWTVLQHRDVSGGFSGALERADTPGQALVVTDLDALLRRDAPFARVDGTRLRITAQTTDGPAFLGLAPAAEVANYLRPAPYTTVDRVAVASGPLPVRTNQVTPAQDAGPAPDRLPGPTTAPVVAAPREQSFWVRQGLGGLDWAATDVRGQRLSLVIMHPDAQARLAVDLRAEVRSGWLDPAAWGLLAGGTVLIVLAVVILSWPVRPREVVIVVEPSQVPALAARVGLSTLSDLGRSAPAHDAPSDPAAGEAARPGPVLDDLPSAAVVGEAAPSVAGAPSAGTGSAVIPKPSLETPPVRLALSWPPPSPVPATPAPALVAPGAGTPVRPRSDGAGRAANGPSGCDSGATDCPAMTNSVPEREAGHARRRNEAKYTSPIA
jgi:hypothetical protein